MKNRIRQTKKSLRKGFSLVELLVVIAIMAIIGVTVIPRLAETRTSAFEQTAKRLQSDLNRTFAQWQALGGTANSPGAYDALTFLTGAADRTATGAMSDSSGALGSSVIQIQMDGSLTGSDGGNATYDETFLVEFNGGDSPFDVTII